MITGTFDFIAPGNNKPKTTMPGVDLIWKKLQKCYATIMNQTNAELSFYRTATSIEHLLERYQVNWKFLIPETVTEEYFSLFKERSENYIHAKDRIDLGRDQKHPGIES